MIQGLIDVIVPLKDADTVKTLVVSKDGRKRNETDAAFASDCLAKLLDFRREDTWDIKCLSHLSAASVRTVFEYQYQ